MDEYKQSQVIGDLMLECMDVSSNSRKFRSQLESLKTQIKIKEIEVRGKLQSEQSGLLISVEGLQRGLLRNIEQEENLKEYLKITLKRLEDEMDETQKMSQKLLKRFQKIEYDLGTDTEYLMEEAKKECEKNEVQKANLDLN
ncbi:hypothetical protein PPERSA_00545 [Pseudocohnilembus persalinus]|uniref:Uncharacterized protein n=1 Tax=Pseudocohnilembus persalinus TaxID=266149 RepID=A0A0V0QI65_PSEPJ|nr:hypothetical protein PPERSA_00545 [Pseudocohnilembus persalinus]|eukprot:KRX01835.1 hypothetical protein PPERSA_00545 [Pseudocohnilembus persalinus]